MGLPQMPQTCDLTGMEGSEERRRDGSQFLRSFADAAVRRAMLVQTASFLDVSSRSLQVCDVWIKGHTHRCVTMTLSDCSLSVCSLTVKIIV